MEDVIVYLFLIISAAILLGMGVVIGVYAHWIVRNR